MVAYTRQPKQPQSVTPLVCARRMVAETFLPDEPDKPRRRMLSGGDLLAGTCLIGRGSRAGLLVVAVGPFTNAPQ